MLLKLPDQGTREDLTETISARDFCNMAKETVRAFRKQKKN
jgi:hypothetical protein